MGKLVTFSGPPRTEVGDLRDREDGAQPQFAGTLPPDRSDGGELAQSLAVLKRRRGFIIGCAMLLTLLAAIVVFQLTPRYTAEATVMLDTRKTQVVDIQAVMSGLQSDAAVVRSEVEVLKSPDLARKVVARLDLIKNKLTNPALMPPSFWSRINPVSIVKGYFVPTEMALPKTPEQQKQEEEERVVVQMLDLLTVVNDGRSYIIKIRFESEDPALAASVANTYAELYLEQQLETKFDATRRASNWLNAHLDELRDKVRESAAAVQTFRDQHQLTQTKGSTVTSQQLTELNSQMILAAADRAQKEASLRQIQEMLKSSGGTEGAGQVLASPAILQLKAQQTELRRKEAELATRYKPAHPEMINIRAQIADVNRKIQEEATNIVRSMTADVNAARSREVSLRDSLQSLQKSAGVQNVAEVQLSELEREAEANRALYENFLGRFKQTSAQEDMQQPDARIVGRADTPGTPTFPRKGVMIGLTGVLSLLLGIAGAFTLERLDNGFHSTDQAEQLSGAPCLGLIPAVSAGHNPHELVAEQPVSSYAESIRSIRTGLNFTNVDSPPKLVLVTSSVPKEGKSVFATSFASSVARSGGRALIIDCDLRHPSVGKLLGASKGPGLLSYFSEGTDPSALIQIDERTGLHYLPVREGASNPQDLLGSQHMKTLLEGLREKYDLIVLDAPPVLAVSDALVLSHIADATVFLIRWQETPRPVALGALKLLRTQGAGVSGFVMSRVDVRKHAKYGYGDSGYYYGRYGSYYGKRA